MAITKHVKHIRSSVADSIPTTEQLDYGEIAINYSTDKERLFIKNANNEIVPFYSGKVIEENEQVTAAALTDLDSRINDIEENNVNTENMESVSYSELKSKRDNGELVPGKHYRITDYVTTTAQENTQSAGHQFDVVVLALDESTLSENAHAMLHEGDTYFSTNGADLSAWELKYCLDNDQSRFAWAVSANRTIEPYDNAFRGCKLVECRQVGDELRLYKNYRNPSSGEENLTDEAEYFVYVGTLDYEGDTYYAWQKKDNGGFQSLILTKTLYQPGEITPNAEPSYVISSDYSDVSGGKGVIYYMKDEWNNECPYDFKNIQFKRWAITSVKNSNNESISDLEDVFNYDSENNPICFGYQDSGYEMGSGSCTIDSNTSVFYYTLSRVDSNGNIMDNSIVGNTMGNDDDLYQGVINNVFKPSSNGINEVYGTNDTKTCLRLCDNVFVSTSVYDRDMPYGVFGNTFGTGCYHNTFGNECRLNTFGNECYNNSFGNYVSRNTFGNYFRYNTFGNDCWYNTFGNNADGNTFGNNAYGNTFGNGCGSNTFGNYFRYNTFGNGCGSNTFGNSCGLNTFGNGCGSNTFGNDCWYNTFGNYVANNTFGNSCGSNTFGNSCSRNSFGNYFRYNTFGNGCESNTFGNGCGSNTFGNAVNHVTFSKDYTYYVIVENGNQYITLTSTATTSSSKLLRNITIAQGTNNATSESGRKTITHTTTNDEIKTTYQPANSVVVNV